MVWEIAGRGRAANVNAVRRGDDKNAPRPAPGEGLSGGVGHGAGQAGPMSRHTVGVAVGPLAEVELRRWPKEHVVELHHAPALHVGAHHLEEHVRRIWWGGHIEAELGPCRAGDRR